MDVDMYQTSRCGTQHNGWGMGGSPFTVALAFGSMMMSVLKELSMFSSVCNLIFLLSRRMALEELVSLFNAVLVFNQNPKLIMIRVAIEFVWTRFEL